MSFKSYNVKDLMCIGCMAYLFNCTRIISSKNNVYEVVQFGMIFSKLRFKLPNTLFRDKYAKNLQYTDKKQARVQAN